MIFNPGEPKNYDLSLIANNLDLQYRVQCDFKKEGTEIMMETTIKKISFDSNSSMDKEVNDDYQNILVYDFRYFDKKGHLKSEVERQRIVNTELLVVEFPDKEIKVGDSWQGKNQQSLICFLIQFLQSTSVKKSMQIIS